MSYYLIKDTRNVKIDDCVIEYTYHYVIEEGDLNNLITDKQNESKIEFLHYNELNQAYIVASELNDKQEEKFKNILTLLDAKKNYYNSLYNHVCEIMHTYNIINYNQ